LSPTFGLAGLAEAAEAQALLLAWGATLCLLVVALVGLALRSRPAAGLAVGLAALLGLMCVPWGAFLPVESSDPDVHYWVAAWRTFGIAWAVAAAAAVAAGVRAFRGEKVALDPPGTEPAADPNRRRG
jgi:hypothetical protein